MAARTLTQGRAHVLALLDDPNGRRFNADGLFTRLDIALQDAISACISDYASNGGDLFDEEVTVATSAAGLATLTVFPAIIRSVQVAAGAAFFSLQPRQRSERVVNDSSVRSLRVSMVREYALSATGGDPLIGVAAVAGPSWPAFDAWVCAEAALELGIGDNDKRPGLEALSAKRRQTALDRQNSIPFRELPNSDGDRDGWWTQLGYLVTTSPTTPTIQVLRSLGW